VTIAVRYHDTTVEIPVTGEQLADLGPVYVGWRQPDDAENDGPQVFFVEADGRARGVSHCCCHALRIDWGDGGGGSADLALSLLGHYVRGLLGEFYGDVNDASPQARTEAFDAAFELHQPFKRAKVARFAEDCWVLPTSEIWFWLRSMTTDALTSQRIRTFLAVLLDAVQLRRMPMARAAAVQRESTVQR
jgi:hypothetical protein